ncbi:unnamed protein product [Vitrella brassicaformis CCMP3155]|uniref:Protein kinase domain-containing protein n=1 Tax=Vitrella brassicaformis (strain CCMP3155) TaxID=1169540 RepID=A0A0G4EK25_VITBC|nr:unnamed protein product [Vitrella brassicaformis CCMP3155]|eukprot:CEL96865.1 unnamed protein product [Vitrella brassicaformis CCMP3155]
MSSSPPSPFPLTLAAGGAQGALFAPNGPARNGMQTSTLRAPPDQAPLDQQHQQPQQSSVQSPEPPSFAHPFAVPPTIPPNMSHPFSVPPVPCYPPPPPSPSPGSAGDSPTSTASSMHTPYRREPTLIQSVADINDMYEMKFNEKLGSGHTGEVFDAVCRQTNQQRAIKRIHKTDLKLVVDESYFRDIYDFIVRCGHPNLVKICEVLEDPEHFYIVMEKCKGPDLVDFTESFEPGDIPEADCKRIMRNLLAAVRHLHEHRLLHRDIKLDNVLFKDRPGGQVVLLDFDMCMFIDRADSPKTVEKEGEISVVGTRGYMAPECYKGQKGQYTQASDLWGCGVILYVLITGNFPFILSECKSSREVRRVLRQGFLKFEDAVVQRFPAATDLISRLLTYHPNGRPSSAQEALDHPWFGPSLLCRPYPLTMPTSSTGLTAPPMTAPPWMTPAPPGMTPAPPGMMTPAPPGMTPLTAPPGMTPLTAPPGMAPLTAPPGMTPPAPVQQQGSANSPSHMHNPTGGPLLPMPPMTPPGSSPVHNPFAHVSPNASPSPLTPRAQSLELPHDGHPVHPHRQPSQASSPTPQPSPTHQQQRHNTSGSDSAEGLISPNAISLLDQAIRHTVDGVDLGGEGLVSMGLVGMGHEGGDDGRAMDMDEADGRSFTGAQSNLGAGTAELMSPALSHSTGPADVTNSSSTPQIPPPSLQQPQALPQPGIPSQKRSAALLTGATGQQQRQQQELFSSIPSSLWLMDKGQGAIGKGRGQGMAGTAQDASSSSTGTGGAKLVPMGRTSQTGSAASTAESQADPKQEALSVACCELLSPTLGHSSMTVGSSGSALFGSSHVATAALSHAPPSLWPGITHLGPHIRGNGSGGILAPWEDSRPQTMTALLTGAAGQQQQQQQDSFTWPPSSLSLDEGKGAPGAGRGQGIAGTAQDASSSITGTGGAKLVSMSRRRQAKGGAGLCMCMGSGLCTACQ